MRHAEQDDNAHDQNTVGLAQLAPERSGYSLRIVDTC